MGGILMALAWGFILGAVLAPRYIIPWVRWRWPQFARAVFGAGILLACVTAPVPAQVDTTRHPHEPAGAARLWEHDFTGPRPGAWAPSGQAGCWFSNGGTLVLVNGLMQVRYPMGWSGGRTPATLHSRAICPPTAPPQVATLYVHLSGYTPGTAGTFWQHAVGHKVFFAKVGSPPNVGRGSVIFYCGSLTGVAGPASACRFDVKFESAGNPANWNLKGDQYLRSGQPNDIECVLTAGSIGAADGSATCWVNGQPVTFLASGGARSPTALPMRVAGETALFYEGWLDWTFGGTAGAKGMSDLFTLDAAYASGR